MRISGFSFVRNAFVFGYPLAESINSLLPLCDEYIIAAGRSDDDTLDYLHSLDDPRIVVIETEWDESMRIDARIYSQQTNIALDRCRGDWCIYLQADEVLHEKDYDVIAYEIRRAYTDPDVEALLFRYRHFYGSYDYVGSGRQWYRREVRAFRNTGNITSWGDAQGFRISDKGVYRKLRARQTEAGIYHYGWVRPPVVQSRKIMCAETYYHEDARFDMNDDSIPEFDYNSAYDLDRYEGTHPAVMADKIRNDSSWTSGFDPSRVKKKPFLMKASDGLEKLTGFRIGEFKDFEVVR